MATMTSTPQFPTTRQISFISSLLEERELSPNQRTAADRRMAHEGFNRVQASLLIDELLKQPVKKRTVDAPRLEAGMYRLNGRIFKVQLAVHGSGKLYAKELLENPDGSWTFCYQPGAITRLRPENRMSIEEAKSFGALYGTCCVCGKVLTNERSIAEGIGPVCGDRV